MSSSALNDDTTYRNPDGGLLATSSFDKIHGQAKIGHRRRPVNEWEKRHEEMLPVTQPNPWTGPMYGSFACPFFKHHIQTETKAHPCEGLRFTSASRVKTHIYDIHCIENSCPRRNVKCKNNEKVQRQRKRKPLCSIDEGKVIVITPGQKQSLKNRKRTFQFKGDPVGQWRAIWEIVFPGEHLPPSPYRDREVLTTPQAPYGLSSSAEGRDRTGDVDAFPGELVTIFREELPKFSGPERDRMMGRILEWHIAHSHGHGELTGHRGSHVPTPLGPYLHESKTSDQCTDQQPGLQCPTPSPSLGFLQPRALLLRSSSIASTLPSQSYCESAVHTGFTPGPPLSLLPATPLNFAGFVHADHSNTPGRQGTYEHPSYTATLRNGLQYHPASPTSAGLPIDPDLFTNSFSSDTEQEYPIKAERC